MIKVVLNCPFYLLCVVTRKRACMHVFVRTQVRVGVCTCPRVDYVCVYLHATKIIYNNEIACVCACLGVHAPII